MLIYCPKCEAGNREDADICSQCGQRLSDAELPAQVPTASRQGLRRTLSRKSRSIFALCNLAAVTIIAVVWLLTRAEQQQEPLAESEPWTDAEFDFRSALVTARPSSPGLRQYTPGHKYCTDDGVCYEVLKEEVFDEISRAQLNLSVVFRGTITEDALRGMLSRLREEAVERTGFAHTRGLTHLFIYVFASVEHWEGSTWIGMHSEIAGSTLGPRVDIRSGHIAALNEPKTPRFGLTYRRRQRLFNMAALLSFRASSAFSSASV